MRKCSIELVDNGFIVRDLDEPSLKRSTILVYPHLSHLLDFLHAEFNREAKEKFFSEASTGVSEAVASAFQACQTLPSELKHGSDNTKIAKFENTPPETGDTWKINPPGKLVIARPGDKIRADGVVIPQEQLENVVQVVKKKAKSVRRRK